MPARVSGVDADGSLMLADGRRLVLAHVVLPSRLDPTPTRTAAATRAALSVLQGQELRLALDGRDRHGRLTGSAVLASEPEADLAQALVAAGAAYATGEGPCGGALLAAEDTARRTRRGLWGTAHAVLDAQDETELARFVGHYAVAEGRVRAVGVSRDRTYVNFGETWRRDFTAIVPKADFATIFGHGQDPAMLRDSRVRVRGVVREQGGPAILVRSASDLERIEDQSERQRQR